MSRTAQEQPLVRGAVFVATFLFIFGTLIWLHQRAEAVDLEQHFAYTHHLRELQTINAIADRELLANRQELVRNYDALTQYTHQALEISERGTHPPAFLLPGERHLVEENAHQLQDTLRRKADLIDRFKRFHSVLRNSLAYFPTAAADLLDSESGRRLPPKIYLALSHYVRHVLAYTRAPDGTGLDQMVEARRQLVAVAWPDPQRAQVDNLVRHGDVIAERMGEIDRLTREIFSLRSEVLMENLDRTYMQGYATALAEATRYRKLMNALAVVLAGLLAWTLVRLERARRLLLRSHAELNTRYAAQLATEKVLQLHATAFHNAQDGITLTDAAGNILDVNPAFTRITGYKREEVIGRNPRILKSGRQDAAFYAAMWKSVEETGRWRGEIWNRNKYGEIYPELMSISAVRDATGKLTNYVAVFADISRIKTQEEQLQQIAFYDALTGLPNRVLLADRLQQAMLQSQRHQQSLAVAYLDLDGFKAVNDRYGHDIGDALLVALAQRMKEALREGDTLSRIGGDEFVAVLVDLDGEQGCEPLVERLLQAAAEPVMVGEAELQVSASIGLTLYPRDGADADQLMRHADQAMYQAKQAGKNRYHLFDVEQDAAAQSQRESIERIRHALERNEFVLYYQPKVNMKSGEVIGAEALIRWQHPERGLLPPAEFLPIIEDHALSVDIGEWVISTALRQISAWHAAGLELAVSVNVGARQMQQPGFVSRLAELLAAHPEVEPTRLELEILETSALEDVVQVSGVMHASSKLGVQFALDDFGTGYSSLTYLKHLPAELLKIDHSFVRDMRDDPDNIAIVEGVIGLATAFRRQVIAEGVETVAHGELLLALGCELAQGYGIARPMPAAELSGWVADWRPDAAWTAWRGRTPNHDDRVKVYAEVEHHHWVRAVETYLAGDRAVLPPLDAHECRFGRWLETDAEARYGTSPEFKTMVAAHDHVHRVVRELVELHVHGQHDAALARLDELHALRDELLATVRGMGSWAQRHCC